MGFTPLPPSRGDETPPPKQGFGPPPLSRGGAKIKIGESRALVARQARGAHHPLPLSAKPTAHQAGEEQKIEVAGLTDTGPVDGGVAVGDEELVGAGEVAAAEEAPVGREWRGMGGGEHMVPVQVNELALGDGVAAPEEEDDATATLAEGGDGGVGELLPAVALVAAGTVCADGEGGIEEQDALLGPAAEVATGLGDVNT